MKYRVKTRKVIEFEYEYDYNLPLAPNDNVVDRLIATAVKTGSLLERLLADEKGVVLFDGEEKITGVFRGDKQVYPRLRGKAEKVAPQKEALPLNGVEDE